MNKIDTFLDLRWLDRMMDGKISFKKRPSLYYLKSWNSFLRENPDLQNVFQFKDVDMELIKEIYYRGFINGQIHALNDD